MKSIYETLAALGTGAILLTAGCAGSTAATPKSPEATTPASPKESGGAVVSTEADTAGDATKAESPAEAATKDNAAAAPAEAMPAAAAPATTSPAPATTTAKKAAPKASSPTKTATKKKDAAGGCGEGTCS